MMRKLGPALVAAIIGVAFLIFNLCTYIVYETDQVVVTQFGKPIGEPVTEPGLNFLIPFIQKVNRFDKRFLEWDGSRNQLPTRDKRFIYVDTYARWRISDPLLYFQRLRDERGAQSRLDDILDGETRNVIARHDLIEVVRTSDREFAIDDDDVGGMSNDVEGEPKDRTTDFVIVNGREALAHEVLAKAQERTQDLGLEILDFQFKRINYVEAVRTEVYSRMISERKRIAEQFRSEGTGEAARINGERERALAAITSEAYRNAEEIRGTADAEAANIYAEAYNANPEFYAFVKSLETYQAAVDDNTILLLSTEGELLQYLEDATP